MTGQLVLLTGGNGHIGFRTLLKALESGYSVRAAVRSQAKADQILDSAPIKKVSPGSKLTFTIVPDLVLSGAYNEAVKGVDYIIHLASPIPNGANADDFETQLIQPAVQGTTGILYSALKAPSVKRVVITSSGVAQASWHDLFEVDPHTVFNETSRIPDEAAKGPYGSEFEAYCASKVMSLNAAERFEKEQNPHFSIVKVHPMFVIGRNTLITDPKHVADGTNGTMLAQVLGQDIPFAVPSAAVSVEDIASLHVMGLDPKIPNGQSLLGYSGGPKGTRWADAIDIVQEHFPEAVKSGVLPNNGLTNSKTSIFDVSETERLTGIKWKTYEEQVLDVTTQYLELAGIAVA